MPFNRQYIVRETTTDTYLRSFNVELGPELVSDRTLAHVIEIDGNNAQDMSIAINQVSLINLRFNLNCILEQF